MTFQPFSFWIKVRESRALRRRHGVGCGTPVKKVGGGAARSLLFFVVVYLFRTFFSKEEEDMRVSQLFLAAICLEISEKH